jgi:hypothetical protein
VNSWNEADGEDTDTDCSTQPMENTDDDQRIPTQRRDLETSKGSGEQSGRYIQCNSTAREPAKSELDPEVAKVANQPEFLISRYSSTHLNPCFALTGTK